MRLKQLPGYNRLKKHLDPGHQPDQAEGRQGRRRIRRARTRKTLMPEYLGRRRVESRIRRVIYGILSVFTYLVTPISSRFRPAGPEMKDWMSRLYTGARANTRIVDSTMIGSHDTASYGLSGFGSSMAITQSQSIGTQLEAGVRYLDIRVTLNPKGEYVVHHGPYHGKKASRVVVEPLKKFLKKHPDEVVVMKLQFAGMSKAAARQFLKTECAELMNSRAISNRDRHGNRLGPGSLTFADARAAKRNLLVTVSDEHLAKSDKMNQKELGSHAWLHGEFTNDLWPNSSDVRNVRVYNEEYVLDKMTRSKEDNDGKLNILQLQTNINPTELLRGGINSVERLAGFSNKEIPDMLRKWYKDRGFVANIALMDFVGHYNYRDLTLLTLTFSSRSMSEAELRVAFPKLYRAILHTREQLEN